MTQIDKAHAFAAAHVPGRPLMLFNIWDVGSARAVADAGAVALATGSWSVAHAQGFDDGQDMPLDLITGLVSRIAGAVDLPVSLDFEGGYAEDSATLAANTAAILATGAIGINFEDRVIGDTGLVSIEEQATRIATIRQAADAVGIPLFVNARTDLFFQDAPVADHPGLLIEALDREAAYAEAGANGLFVPGLSDATLIEKLCKLSLLPVNIMRGPKTPDTATLADCGVARISHGPGPFIRAMKHLTTLAQAEFAAP